MAWQFNDPYPEALRNKKIVFSSFAERPKTLDPAKAYSSNEYGFIGQIYEPVLQYDYLKRPYQVIPQTAAVMPTVQYLDKDRQLLPAEADDKTISYSVYTIQLKRGIKYQPHPAFAKDKQGSYYYHDLADDYLETHDINALAGFAHQGSRELIADDYIYQVKRLASPKTHSPILGLMSEYIVGLKDYAQQLSKLPVSDDVFFDLRQYPLKGVKKINDYEYQIILKGKYPQFMYWLAMPFFSPIPWEVDKFYSQADMDENNLNFNWYPVGTGAFMLTENNPNRRMVLTKNPNYHEDYFPTKGSDKDKQRGYLQSAGKRLPLIEKAIYSLEKEAIPRWNKFLQGYYDSSGISADSFDQAIKIDQYGKVNLTPELAQKGIRLQSTVEPSIFYLGFNMLDSVVGGGSERARKLRLAISIAINQEENIAIFYNGRGRAAQGPLPPGIFGYIPKEKGINPYVYRWHKGYPQRLSIEHAKELMRQAGYPNGRNSSSGKALLLNYDVPASNGPDDKARLDWMRKQFEKLGIQLNVRATQYNRFQQKMRNGNAQIFAWGWNADYPDPENFLFLLYGPNGKVKHKGENAANYNNPRFDALFGQMKNMANTPERLAIIQQMVAIVRHDAPWVWGIYPKTFVLSQQWKLPQKPNAMAHNILKYVDIDTSKRSQKQQRWNQAVLWPIGLVILLIVILILPIILAYRNKERSRVNRYHD